MACPASEADLLSVYFEEVALKHAEDRRESERKSRNSSSSAHDFDTDEVIGDDDEGDWYEDRED